MQGTLQFALIVCVFSITVTWLNWCKFFKLSLCSSQTMWKPKNDCPLQHILFGNLSWEAIPFLRKRSGMKVFCSVCLGLFFEWALLVLASEVL